MHHTVQPFVNPRELFKAAELRALKTFARSKPWRGSIEERQGKFLALHAAFMIAHGLDWQLIFMPHEAASGFAIDDQRRTVTMAGKLSVITYLFAISQIRGVTVQQSARWSLSLFARIFKRSAEKLVLENGRIASR